MLYEASGVFTRLYGALGYHVIQVDWQLDGQDVRLLQKQSLDVVGILAFPPCTHLAGSGARWWKRKGEQALLDALSCVDAVFRLVQIYQPQFWVIENPVGRLSRFLGKPKQIFNPCEYAGYLDDPLVEAYTKKTCLWGHFAIPEKKPVAPIHGSMMARLKDPVTGKFYAFNSQACKTWRSKTPLGFARAFVQANHPATAFNGNISDS